MLVAKLSQVPPKLSVNLEVVRSLSRRHAQHIGAEAPLPCAGEPVRESEQRGYGQLGEVSGPLPDGDQLFGVTGTFDSRRKVPLECSGVLLGIRGQPDALKELPDRIRQCPGAILPQVLGDRLTRRRIG